jgi:hypothetical protein
MISRRTNQFLRAFRAVRPTQAKLPLRSQIGASMTLGNAAVARLRLIVWCKECRHQVEPDVADLAERFGADMPVLKWKERLVCSGCGLRRVNMVVTGERR